MQKCTGRASNWIVASMRANHPGAVYLISCTCRRPRAHSAWSQGLNNELSAAKRVGGTLRRPSHGRRAFGMSWVSRDGAWQRQGQTLGHPSCIGDLLFVAVAADSDVSSMSGVSGPSLAGSCNDQVRSRRRTRKIRTYADVAGTRPAFFIPDFAWPAIRRIGPHSA